MSKQKLTEFILSFQKDFGGFWKKDGGTNRLQIPKPIFGKKTNHEISHN